MIERTQQDTEQFEKFLRRAAEPRHTPGPWVFEKRNGCVWEKGYGVVCEVAVNGEPLDAEGQANARLIAVSPDMLDSLYDALPQLRWANCHGSRCDEIINRIEEVIQKTLR